MNKCTLYAGLYMATLLLLAGCLFEWATTLEFGGMSYGCGEEMPIFTANDAAKVLISAATICAWGIVGQILVVRTCTALHESKTSNTGDETI